MDVKLPSQMNVVDWVGLDGMGLDISRWDEVKSTVSANDRVWVWFMMLRDVVQATHRVLE